MILEPSFETMAPEPLRALQLERLRALLARVKERVPLYRERLARIEPEQIASLDDLRRLPFTRKDDLRETYPFGLLAVPREELVRIHASSGTTGKRNGGCTKASAARSRCGSKLRALCRAPKAAKLQRVVDRRSLG